MTEPAIAFDQAAASGAAAIPAATLVLFREQDGGPPELLIVERARAMVFAGGALVFPGGRIDPEDRALAALHAPDDVHGAARIAAIREMIEEAGVATGLSPQPDATQLARLRQGLHRGEPFGALLNETGTMFALDRLVPFARWLPAHAHMRIFDTMFFIAALPEGAPPPIVDQTENSRVFWMSARQVLIEADAGRATIIFPTRRNLERLAQFASFADAVADARRHPVEAITPWTEERDGQAYLRIPEGRGYPVTEEPIATAMRG